MTANDWLSLVIVLVCLLLSAFFAGSETALTASSRASMARLEKHGNRRAAIVNRLLEQRERLLGALLFGNNAVNIAASALATGVLLTWFGNAGVVYATVAMTILVVVFSEILPKTAALNAPDRIALIVARPLFWFVKLFGPVLMAVEARAEGRLRVVQVDHRQALGSQAPVELVEQRVDDLRAADLDARAPQVGRVQAEGDPPEVGARGGDGVEDGLQVLEARSQAVAAAGRAPTMDS